jgi:hypothetical protein
MERKTAKIIYGLDDKGNRNKNLSSNTIKLRFKPG